MSKRDISSKPTAVFLSVILSFRNEAKVIPELIQRLQRALADLPQNYEILFVNDDSTDDSLALLRDFARKDDRIKVLNMSRRFGVYECLTAGFAHSRGDIVIYLDADLQDPPELIPELIAKWRKGYDVVYTVRTARKGESRAKVWLTRIAYWVLHSISDVNLPVEAGDYRLLTRRAVNQLLRFQEAEPYFRGQSSWVGFCQASVHYRREARVAGRTQRSFLSGEPARVFLSAITSFSTAPLHFVLVLGIVGLLVTGMGGVITGLIKLAGGAVSGNWLLVVYFTLLWTLGILALGIVAIYIARILVNTRNRPLYVIKDGIGVEGVPNLEEEPTPDAPVPTENS